MERDEHDKVNYLLQQLHALRDDQRLISILKKEEMEDNDVDTTDEHYSRSAFEARNDDILFQKQQNDNIQKFIKVKEVSTEPISICTK